MQVERKSITTAKSAKDYLSRNDVPQLFECLMTGLMYHRPSDHITYLQDCLERIKKQGVNGVRWDMFLDSKKTPLPPIDSAPRENYRPQPLPEIGSLQLRISIDASVVIVQAGPGIDKKSICKSLVKNFPDYIHIETGSILRQRALIEAQDSDSRWKLIKNGIDDGDLVSEEFVVECLIKEMNKHNSQSKFIIEGFPRTDKERGVFERFIGFNRLKFMLLIDCEEETCQRLLLKRLPLDGWCDHYQPSVIKRILNYKSNTLAVCKFFDDRDKLRVIDGDKDRELVMKDILRAFEKELVSPPCLHPLTPDKPPDIEPEPEATTSPGREPVVDILELLDVTPESKRNLDLPQCRLVLLLGGPGSGKSTVCQFVCNKHPTWVHLDINAMIRKELMTSASLDQNLATRIDIQPFVENFDINIEVLKEMIKLIPEGTELIILEGYPKIHDQLNQFNSEIGRADFVILLDSEEEAMRTRLAQRYCGAHNLEDDEINSDLRMLYFKDNGLPICRHYDEANKMCIVPADRDILYVIADLEKVAVKKLEMLAEEDSAAAAIEAARAAAEDAAKPKIDPENQNTNEIIENEEVEYNEHNRLVEDKIDISGGHKSDKDDSEPDLIFADSAAWLYNNDNPEHDLVEEISDIVSKEFGGLFEDKNTAEKAHIVDNVDNAQVDIIGGTSVNPTELEGAHVVLLMGGPGSGKKTLATHLVSKYLIAFIHVDQLVKDAIELESVDTEQFQKYLENKDFDETAIFSLIRRSLMSSMSMSKILLVTGFPRTVGQYLRFIGEVSPVSASIFLDVDEDTLKTRLAVRANPDLPLDYTDQLEVFKNTSPALLEELSDNELFIKIDGSQTEVEVLEQAGGFLDKFHFMKHEEMVIKDE